MSSNLSSALLRLGRVILLAALVVVVIGATIRIVGSRDSADTVLIVAGGLTLLGGLCEMVGRA